MHPGLPAQKTEARISGFYNVMGLNEWFLTPTFNYSLENVLVIELKVTRDQLEERCGIRFSSVPNSSGRGAIHLVNKYFCYPANIYPRPTLGRSWVTVVNMTLSTWGLWSSPEEINNNQVTVQFH